MRSNKEVVVEAWELSERGGGGGARGGGGGGGMLEIETSFQIVSPALCMYVYIYVCVCVFVGEGVC